MSWFKRPWKSGTERVVWQICCALLVSALWGSLVYLLTSCSVDDAATDDAGRADSSVLESRSDAGAAEASGADAGTVEAGPDGKCGGCLAADKSCRAGTEENFCGAGGLACQDVTSFACAVGTPDESVRAGCEQREYPCSRRACDGHEARRCCFRTESMPRDGRPMCRDLP